ncbi:hypothetical protein TSMEX_002536 [Taenia solium]|eukprot:TsM_000526800 transcript=TsM_000526800 gene=TsM_000526800
MDGLSGTIACRRAASATRAHIPMFEVNDMFVYSPKSRGSALKRRSHSHIDSKQAVELRRVKKQNVERTRHARISDRIVELHGLALSMVGQNRNALTRRMSQVIVIALQVGSSVRMGKAEMLNFCHEVLSGLHNLLGENPQAKARLQAHHGGVGATTTAGCEDLVPSHIPAFTSTSASTFTLSVSIPQSIPCDSGVFDLPASTSASVVQSSSVVNSNYDPTDCPVQPKESKGIWRPYLHCL